MQSLNSPRRVMDRDSAEQRLLNYGLSWACRGGWDVEAVKLALEKGADPNWARGCNLPPLNAIFVQAGFSAAAITSRLQMLGLLVAAKADLEIRDVDGVKALKLAANNGVVRLVAALLDAGADPWDVDADGHNVLQAVLPDGDEKWSPSPAILGLLKERYPDMYMDAWMAQGSVRETTP